MDKPFVVLKIIDSENSCAGCGKVGCRVMITPMGVESDIEVLEKEWLLCNKCLQWLKNKLMGF